MSKDQQLKRDTEATQKGNEYFFKLSLMFLFSPAIFFHYPFFFVSFLGGNEGIYCVFDYWRSTSLYYCLDNDENIDKATTTSMKTNDGMYTD